MCNEWKTNGGLGHTVKCEGRISVSGDNLRAFSCSVSESESEIKLMAEAVLRYHHVFTLILQLIVVTFFVAFLYTFLGARSLTVECTELVK